jgi:hypothetical protein
MRKTLLPALAALAITAASLVSSAPLALHAQLPDSTKKVEEDAARNAQQAREALDKMVQALGGDAWLHQQNREIHGRTASFFHGKPSGGDTEYWEFHSWPDNDRYEYTKHRDVVQIYTGRVGWEIIFSGKKELPKEQQEEYLRRRDHSIETVIKEWLKDPNTILIYEGQQLAERHLAEQVTLISSRNESVTIQMDADTHLPLKRTFQWRDPLYKDKNEDAEEYANYRPVDGFQTPFTVSRSKNGDMVNERFVLDAHYNQPLPPDEFSPDAAAAKIVKK